MRGRLRVCVWGGGQGPFGASGWVYVDELDRSAPRTSLSFGQSPIGRLQKPAVGGQKTIKKNLCTNSR